MNHQVDLFLLLLYDCPGNHTIIARTDLPGDSNPANDEYTKTVLNGTVYCNPSMDCSFGDGFTNVTVSDLNHDSECEGYADFTAFSAELAPELILQKKQ